jgi:hypothetical protein
MTELAGVSALVLAAVIVIVGMTVWALRTRRLQPVAPAPATKMRRGLLDGRDAYVARGNQTVANNFPVAVARPREPGLMRKRVWGSVPLRNAAFTGREKLLAAVRETLLAGDRAVVQALHGVGGVGKTQLAAEYAHRFAADYDVVWWINAGRAGLIGGQVAGLANELGCAEPGASLMAVRRAVPTALRERDRWLLVFDNVENPGDVTGWLPGGNGHVLITSRASGWAEIAVPVEVDVMSRAESVAILQRQVTGLGDAEAGQVAEALGDLPLAVAQAAGSMAKGAAAREYLDLLRPEPADLMDERRPSSCPQSLTAATQIALGQLSDEDPAAAELIRVCAFLAPEPVPGQWFAGVTAQLPAQLARAAADSVAWPHMVARAGRRALATSSQDGLQMHELTRDIVRECLPGTQAAAARELASAVLAASHPGDPRSPETWPGWARLLPHLLALDPAAGTSTSLRALACDAAWYLVLRGDGRGGHDLASTLFEHWKDQSGPDDLETLSAAARLGDALQEVDRYDQAKVLNEDTLARRRRVLGQDHPDTLQSAEDLAGSLFLMGRWRAARKIEKDTLARRRRVLGEDHPDTLQSANNLAVSLWKLRHRRAARKLNEDTLARRRRVLGENHSATLTSANNLAISLLTARRWRSSRRLLEGTLARRRQILGEAHPDTLTSANNLAGSLFAKGHWRTARKLRRDTLARHRQVLGADHPVTLMVASNLAVDSFLTGHWWAAWKVSHDTRSRRRALRRETVKTARAPLP